MGNYCSFLPCSKETRSIGTSTEDPLDIPIKIKSKKKLPPIPENLQIT